MPIYYIQFLMTNDEAILHKWDYSERFCSKEDAMKFAQNTAKAFNGSKRKLFYRIMC